MKLTPKMKGSIPVGATIELTDADAQALAEVLSYSRHLEPTTKAGKILARLAAACEALDADADAGVESSREYVQTRRLFDPGYGGSEDK